jgi:uncharacterized protein (DUF362 family)/NAD-dependent dihydropyrimidine dehydrogenase PreA subunit
MIARVALIGCPGYEIDDVETALRRGLGLLGGPSRFFSPGETILLKPNLLIASEAEKAVITHPAVFEALCRILRDEGVNIRYGDSPGLGTPRGVMKYTGYTGVAERFAARAADFSRQLPVEYPEGLLLKRMTLCPGPIECDGIVSLSKLKTHGLTRMTGAVKNLFGCVPGLLKSEYHVRMPDVSHFSQALLDITGRLKPRLHIMDAIVAMSGNGPRNGRPTRIGALLLSSDPVALDQAACRLIHLPPELVPTLSEASRWGIGPSPSTDTDLEITGDSLSAFSRPDFDIPRHAVDQLASKRHFPPFLKRFVTPKPIVNPQTCTRCGVCITVCPVKPKAMTVHRDGAPPFADMDRCIRCYCCQELCPHGAITLDTPWLGKLLHRAGRP